MRRMEWLKLHLLLPLIDRVYFRDHIKVCLAIDASPIVFYKRVLSTQQRSRFRLRFDIAHGVLSPETFEDGLSVVVSHGTYGAAAVVAKRALALQNGSQDRLFAGRAASLEHLVPYLGVPDMDVAQIRFLSSQRGLTRLLSLLQVSLTKGLLPRHLLLRFGPEKVEHGVFNEGGLFQEFLFSFRRDRLVAARV